MNKFSIDALAPSCAHCSIRWTSVPRAPAARPFILSIRLLIICYRTGPIHEILDSLPLLGDTTSNQALLFSPPFSPPEVSTPTYPNYTLPPANLTFPAAPSSPPNFSMFVAPTTSSALASLPRTGCAMQAVQQSGFFYEPSAASEGLWLRDTNGWRWQWFINYLMPETNYTVYAVQNETKVAGPINFRTKTGSSYLSLTFALFLLLLS